MIRSELHRKKRAETSRREAAVLILVASGATNRQIAAKLKMAERTVKKYCSSLFRKHGIAGLAPSCKRARLATLVTTSEYPETAARLGSTETTIANWVKAGKTNAQIAADFGRPRSWTVNWLRQIYDKTGMGNRTELAVWSQAKLVNSQELTQ